MEDGIPGWVQHRHKTCCEKGSHCRRQACMITLQGYNFQMGGLVYDTLSSLSYHLTSVFIFFSNLFTNFFVFSKFFSFSHILFSAINPFQCTKYFITSFTFLLFNIFSISHSSILSTSTSFGSFTFHPFTDSLYLIILLKFTTRYYDMCED